MFNSLNLTQSNNAEQAGSLLYDHVQCRTYSGYSTGKIAGDYRLDPPDEPECPCLSEFSDQFTPCDIHNPLPAFNEPVVWLSHEGPASAWKARGYMWCDETIDDTDHGPFASRQDAVDDWDLTKFGDDTQPPDVAELLNSLSKFDLSVEGPAPSMAALACMVKSGQDMAESLDSLRIFGGR